MPGRAIRAPRAGPVSVPGLGRADGPQARSGTGQGPARLAGDVDGTAAVAAVPSDLLDGCSGGRESGRHEHAHPELAEHLRMLVRRGLVDAAHADGLLDTLTDDGGDT